MEVRRISYAEILNAPNAKGLLADYAQECSIPEIGEANPQAKMYEAMEATGYFQSFGIFNCKELAGFASILVYVVPHYGRRIATVESIYVDSAQRGLSAGNALMNALEDYARERECVAILYNARAESRFEKLLSHLQPYQRTNSVFLRQLQK
jgi:GNAT superfamily N-acetyltransferase